MGLGLDPSKSKSKPARNGVQRILIRVQPLLGDSLQHLSSPGVRAEPMCSISRDPRRARFAPRPHSGGLHRPHIGHADRLGAQESCSGRYPTSQCISVPLGEISGTYRSEGNSMSHASPVTELGATGHGVQLSRSQIERRGRWVSCRRAVTVALPLAAAFTPVVAVSHGSCPQARCQRSSRLGPPCSLSSSTLLATRRSPSAAGRSSNRVALSRPIHGAGPEGAWVLRDATPVHSPVDLLPTHRWHA